MAVYNAGDVIRLTRIANGISQEELSDGVCSVQTLHRIENGKTRIKKSLYQQLMAKMERVPEKTYAVCVGKDMELLEEREKIEHAIDEYDYKKADEYLQKMKEKPDENLITKQYIKKMDALLDYYNRRIDEQTQINCLEEIIGMTVTNYKYCMKIDYPFTEQEIYILIHLANANLHIGKKEESVEIYRTVLNCLNLNYMNGEEKTHIEIMIKRNIGCIYGIMEQYEDAIEMEKEALSMAEVYNEGKFVYVIMTDIACHILAQIKEKKRNGEDLRIAKQYLRKAYYLAMARENKSNANMIKERYIKEFNEEI